MSNIIDIGELKFAIRDGELGRRDKKIVQSCINRDRYSYWGLADTYDGVIIDVGANIGGFTCSVAKTAKHVYAFEASTENYKMLKINVNLNELKNVTCFHRVVGDGSDKEIALCHGTTSPSTLWIGEQGTEKIRGISLPEILEITGTSINLLKMDCEGGEYELMMGQPKELIRSFSLIASEIHGHPDYTHDELIQHIESCGFRSHIKPSRAVTCKMGDFWRV